MDSQIPMKEEAVPEAIVAEEVAHVEHVDDSAHVELVQHSMDAQMTEERVERPHYSTDAQAQDTSHENTKTEAFDHT